MGQGVMGLMAQHFISPVAAFAYLLFVLLYFPCISTMAVIKREIGQRWAVFSMGYSTFVAYAVAVSFYQLSLWSVHPLQSLSIVGALIFCFIILWLLCRRYLYQADGAAGAV